MRASVFHGSGQEVVEHHEDVELLAVGPGQVRVRLHAAGVCHSDLSVMNGTLPMPTPLVLGHEGAGEIVELGPGVEHLSVGQRVVIAWTPPCGSCAACRRGEPNLCLQIFLQIAGVPRFSLAGAPLYGFAGIGTFAEETVVPQQGVVPIPPEVPYEIAALLGCAVTTGVGAVLNTARVQPGSSVVVFGCGGVGISAVQGARIAGAAEIVAVDQVPEKLETALRFGATRAVLPAEVDSASAAVTGGEGFDYAIECIGNASTIRAAYDAVRRGGTAVIVGGGRADSIIELNAFELFYMAKKLLGSYYGSADVRFEVPRLLRLWRSGRLDLEAMVTAKMDVSLAQEAFDAMKAGHALRQVLTF